jgi:hypothetical protein
MLTSAVDRRTRRRVPLAGEPNWRVGAAKGPFSRPELSAFGQKPSPDVSAKMHASGKRSRKCAASRTMFPALGESSLFAGFL